MSDIHSPHNACQHRDNCRTLQAKLEVAEAGFAAAIRKSEWQAVTNAELNRLTEQRDELLAACEKAKEWLEEWASAEPYLSILNAAIAKAKEGE